MAKSTEKSVTLAADKRAGAHADAYGPPAEAMPKGMKPGDWFCPTCGELVFASRDSCRKCGPVHEQPAYGKGAPGKGAHDDGWLYVPPGGAPPGGKPGDWICPSCGELVFASRDSCRKCGPDPYSGGKYGKAAGKGYGKALADPYGKGHSPYGAEKGKGKEWVFVPGDEPGATAKGKISKPGDWICPDCGDLVFASRDACRKCGPGGSAVHAEPYGPPRGSAGKGIAPALTNGGVDANSDIAARYLLNGLVEDISEDDLRDYFTGFGEIEEITLRTLKPGSIIGSVKFFNPTAELRSAMLDDPHEVKDTQISVTTSKLQKSAKPGCVEMRAEGAPAPAKGKVKGKGKGRKPGDWICPNCGDNVFASRDACRCGTPKPDAEGEAALGMSRGELE